MIAPLARVLPARAAATPALEADVCILGSGFAGAVLAGALARRGRSVLLIESGPASGAAAPGLDVYESSGPIAYPLASSRFRGAGGTSNLWSGTTPRLHPIDFEPNPSTPVGAPWPIRYDELEPYYLGAEVELEVHGVDGAPYAPPRRDPYPYQLAAPFPAVGELLRRRGIDLAPYRLPRSGTGSQGIRIVNTHLPELLGSPLVTLLTDHTATRIEHRAGGRIEGIRLESLSQPPRTARAGAYVIACGGVESARLLLLSGLGTRSDQVGRNFMEHPIPIVGGGAVQTDWPLTPGSEWLGSEEFLLDAKRRGLGGVRFRIVADVPRGAGGAAPRRMQVSVRGEIECQPAAHNRITLGPQRDAFGNPGARLALAYTDADRRTIAHCEQIVWRLLAQMGAEQPKVAMRWDKWGHHHMGTCRMGDDPATSVVDRDLRVHGTPNLYVASSAVFVTSGVSNPTLTIAALALRLAEYLGKA